MGFRLKNIRANNALDSATLDYTDTRRRVETHEAANAGNTRCESERKSNPRREEEDWTAVCNGSWSSQRGEQEPRRSDPTKHIELPNNKPNCSTVTFRASSTAQSPAPTSVERECTPDIWATSRRTTTERSTRSSYETWPSGITQERKPATSTADQHQFWQQSP